MAIAGDDFRALFLSVLEQTDPTNLGEGNGPNGPNGINLPFNRAANSASPADSDGAEVEGEDEGGDEGAAEGSADGTAAGRAGTDAGGAAGMGVQGMSRSRSHDGWSTDEIHRTHYAQWRSEQLAVERSLETELDAICDL